ncbi:alpha/beta fold hydrolase [Paraburkholderia gardini]|uniref:alpha/beta fold hydrolase n=1 Tax=Paraburkholderia gardini TaxID=2823469 RepID=UPI001D3E1673|nr:alpha/beta fold hydrolase [Paraburkholderia gardini]CAG4920392.1 Haloalkane dehalogenase [Paraburkholderia gardini]
MSLLNKVAKHAGAALLAAGAMLSATHAATQPVVQDRSINANGIELHYLAAGHGDATPVVLLHGYAESSHMWLPLIKQLDDRRVVLAPDLPGAGPSAIPESGFDKKNTPPLPQ